MAEVDRFDLDVSNNIDMQLRSLQPPLFNSNSCQEHIVIPYFTRMSIRGNFMSAPIEIQVTPIKKLQIIGVDVAKQKLDVSPF